MRSPMKARRGVADTIRTVRHRVSTRSPAVPLHRAAASHHFGTVVSEVGDNEAVP
jgi:hypothetical protein